jgi:hypothetical protein
MVKSSPSIAVVSDSSIYTPDLWSLSDLLFASAAKFCIQNGI